MNLGPGTEPQRAAVAERITDRSLAELGEVGRYSTLALDLQAHIEVFVIALVDRGALAQRRAGREVGSTWWDVDKRRIMGCSGKRVRWPDKVCCCYWWMVESEAESVPVTVGRNPNSVVDMSQVVAGLSILRWVVLSSSIRNSGPVSVLANDVSGRLVVFACPR